MQPTLLNRPGLKRPGIRSASLVAFSAALVLAFAVTMVPTFSQARGAPDSFADLAEKLSGAVVNISTRQTVTQKRSVPRPNLPQGSPFEEFFEEFFKRNEKGEGRQRKVNSLGSGFVIDPSGLVVTNNHVIDGADEIFVNFTDGSKLEAELLGTDKKTDIALLKVKSDKPLVSVDFGDSDKMRVGDWVLAIGNPFGLGGTVTAGIVSARNRDINSGPYDDFIQTDASINRGNSGGPLFNMDGKVIGINTAIISPSGGSIGIGFSVPASIAVPVVEQLRDHGETRRGWLGVRIQTVTDEIAEGLGISGPGRGALIAGVDPEGPAGKVDIQPGDVIVKFGGKEVEEMRDLPRIVAESAIGVETDVEILRKGKSLNRSVVVARLKEDQSTKVAAKTEERKSDDEPKTAEALGLTLAPIDDNMREALDIDADVKGVIVAKSDSDGAAGSQGVTEGDIIVAVSQEEVSNPADVVRRIKEVRESGRPRALLLVRNKAGDMRFVAVPLDG